MTPGPAATVFLCGPRPGGNADAAGLAFARGLREKGIAAQVVALRDERIAPCRGCGACLAAGHRCPLDTEGDAAEALFAHVRESPLLAFASPIYFYHVPALFKAFIDRAQRHWAVRSAGEAGEAEPSVLPDVRVLLVAGRPRGEKLFAGTLLSLKYFLWPFYRALAEPCLFRGYDAPGDLAGDVAAVKQAAGYGRDAAHGAF
ncbi:NADPH-dependent FMN reductase [Solidesulfovibrio fructosivorans JJ]]|uniref:NADPH-dependent FMN reductase n=1 Tax=Solidesulfovibrio fructosivorans JJ] TaxID=596151 RepID=E1K090_SOLFR|nr:flavodoxin family protein [Solidesulfovibrio fructosivorans]EFL50008.1 NADPH-dependent FMN reductase [Solidesulfovibrio fructosivorans JJ]]